MAWKPLKGNEASHSINTALNWEENNDLILLREKIQNWGIKKQDKNLITDEKHNVDTTEQSTALSWEEILEEIRDKKNRYMVLLENKRREEQEQRIFLKSEMNFTFPQLYKKMETKIYKMELDKSLKITPEDLAIEILQEMIEVSKKEMHGKWESNMRCNSLDKLTECLEHMVKCHPLRFYASIFLDVTQSLDEFCGLVIKRVKAFTPRENPDYESDDDISLCQNWVLKVMSISSIVPRLYLKCAFIPARKLLGEISRTNLSVLALEIRGVGNILTSTYLRMYLIKVNCLKPKFKVISIHFPSDVSEIAKTCLEDLMRMILNDHWEDSIVELEENLTKTDCCEILAPAIKFIMSYALIDAKTRSLCEILKRLETFTSPPMICAAIDCFPVSFVADKFSTFIEMAERFNSNGINTSSILCSLGYSLSKSSFEFDDVRILNKCWNIIRKFSSFEDYINCAPSWILFSLKNYPLQVVDTMLDDIVKHSSTEPLSGSIYSFEISRVVFSLASKIDVPTEFSQLTNLMPLLHCILDRENVILSCVSIMSSDAFKKCSIISDPSLVTFVLDLFELCNDNYRETLLGLKNINVEKIVCEVLEKFYFADNFDQCVETMVQARSCLFKFPKSYFIMLINMLNLLTLPDTLDKDQMSSVLTYCLITIPTVANTYQGLFFFLICGEFSLKFQCLGQCYSFFELFLSSMESLGSDFTDNETPVNPFEFDKLISAYLLTIFQVPDHPEKETMYLLNRVSYLITGFTSPVLSPVWKASQLAKVLVSFGYFYENFFDPSSAEEGRRFGIFVGEDEFIRLTRSRGEEIIKKIDNIVPQSYFSTEKKVVEQISLRVRQCSDVSDPECCSLLTSLKNISICT